MLLKVIPLWRRYKFPFLLTKPPHFSDMGGGDCPHISKFLESTLHLCYKIDQVHSRPISTGRKGFSDQSDHSYLNGGRFIFVIFFKMGTWFVSQKWSGFRRFVGITYSATF